MARRRSEAEIQNELKRRLEEIEVLKQQALQRGLAFTSPSEEELAKKIRGESGKSPYIYAQGWTSGTTPGSPASYQVWFANPDPGGYYPVFVTIFFGLANFASDISEGFDARDFSWPYVSSASTFLAAGATGSASFSYTTPMVSRGTYLGNAVLWNGSYHDVGTYFDRGLFDVTLH
jgi:hypothetical protein